MRQVIKCFGVLALMAHRVNDDIDPTLVSDQPRVQDRDDLVVR